MAVVVAADGDAAVDGEVVGMASVGARLVVLAEVERRKRTGGGGVVLVHVGRGVPRYRVLVARLFALRQQRMRNCSVSGKSSTLTAAMLRTHAMVEMYGTVCLLVVIAAVDAAPDGVCLWSPDLSEGRKVVEALFLLRGEAAAAAAATEEAATDLCS